MPVNQEFAQATALVYAKGGLRPRRKYERRHPYEQFPMFANQQGQVSNPALEDRPNNIVKVEFLGTFPGYDHYGGTTTYRGFAVTLQGGKLVAGYSLNKDSYVLCLHTEYVAAE
jgi:hypothetical protein